MLDEYWTDEWQTVVEDFREIKELGVIPWVFAFGGGKPLFHGPVIGKQLDFVAVHFYPNKGEVGKALKALEQLYFPSAAS